MLFSQQTKLLRQKFASFFFCGDTEDIEEQLAFLQSFTHIVLTTTRIFTGWISRLDTYGLTALLKF